MLYSNTTLFSLLPNFFQQWPLIRECILSTVLEMRKVYIWTAEPMLGTAIQPLTTYLSSGQL